MGGEVRDLKEALDDLKLTPKPSTLSLKSEPTLVQVCLGYLSKIVEIGPTYILRDNGRIGPAGRSWKEQNGSYTKFEVSTDEGTKKFTYGGVVLSDSNSHDVEIFKNDGRLQIHDIIIDRWYL